MTSMLVASLREKAPLEALADIAAARETLEAEAALQVRRAREQGCSWEAIAAALGISRQAAHKKYAGRVEPRRRGRFWASGDR
ncbi:hypothetical protein [Thermasporomyces composti]|jgi:hypothetical protein|uniref:Homeodomain-like domain-containing protein n=1 Tax=Thermasporomyces composti TaxID=696763 RepID=A0A3D9VCN5_THECX|nr:hypothetical protein [Thermasporomyces composti]REF37930.1 hypothetical protein DFJ64_3391 [Thermasporomyces composti]